MTMTEAADESAPRPRPRPRPRPGARVAGNRQAVPPKPAPSQAAPSKAAPSKAAPSKVAPSKAARPAPAKAAAAKATAATDTEASSAKATQATVLASTARRRQQRSAQDSDLNLVLVVLTVLTLLAAVAVTVLVVQRVTTPARVDPELLPAAEGAYSAMFSIDYTDPEGSERATLAVLTGDLREQVEADLDARVVPTYTELSATTPVDNIMVGLQSVNDEQTEAVVVAYGTYVVESVVSGQHDASAGSECAATADGAQVCVQALQLHLEKVDGTWLVGGVTTIGTA